MRQQATVTNPLLFNVARELRRSAKTRGLPSTSIAAGVTAAKAELDRGQKAVFAIIAGVRAMRDAAESITQPAPLSA